MSRHREVVKKLVEFFDELVKRLREKQMEVTIGDRRISEELGTVKLVVIAAPAENPSGISGTYEIIRKPVHGTGEMFELFNLTVVPGFDAYAVSHINGGLLKEFRCWAGGTIEDRLAVKARDHFREIAGKMPSSEKELKLLDPAQIAIAITKSLGLYAELWAASLMPREEFLKAFVFAQDTLRKAQEEAAILKDKAEKILIDY